MVKAKKTAAKTASKKVIRDGQSASAFFHLSWNVWTVGFYMPGYASAASMTTYGSESEARAAASAFNALRGGR